MTSSNDIGPGDIVVCTDASGLRFTKPLVEGAKYRVRKVVRGRSVVTKRQSVGVLLHGIYCGQDPAGAEYGYLIERFRPVRDSDSEIFRQMIAKLPERELAE